MSSPEQATATQLANIEKRTGKTFAQLAEIVRNSGLTKHGEIRELLQRDLGLGYGDANTLTIIALKSKGQEPVISDAAPADETVNALYTGAKAALRPIHDRLMARIQELGEFEIAPKKTYLSLRRKKQFAMVGPASQARVEVGLNIKGLPATERLVALPPGGMCNYRVNVTDVAAVDAELVGWIRTAYEQSG